MPTDLTPLQTDPPPNENPAPQPQRARPPTPRETSGAYRIATVAGIPIRVHWTFLALLTLFAVLLFGAAPAASSGSLPLSNLLLIVLLFACVVLHELGHALVAARYGYRTRDIVLYPIGGIASLESQPRPRQELWIALAGPMVNVVIALLLYLGLRASGHPITRFNPNGMPTNLLVGLMWENVILVAFNLIPAFPMDGGRVLRALLARFTSEGNATLIAARIGQLMAILLGFYGFVGQYGGPLLIIIAVFVYFGAGQEANAFQARILTEGHRVREAMLHEFRTLAPGNTLHEVRDILLAGSQHDFPVVHGGEVVGVLSRGALLRGMATEGPDAYVAGVMDRDFLSVRPDDALDSLLTQMPALQNGPILVMEDAAAAPNSKLLGMVTQENLLEFLALAQLESRMNPNP